MVALLVTALAIFAIIGIGLYFWQKSAPDNSEYVLPPNPNARGLFADDVPALAENQEELAKAARERDESLIARAKNGEQAALDEAHKSGDAGLYDRVLNELVEQADSEARLLSLMSYVTQNEVLVNSRLAQAVVAQWRETPDRNGATKALHFAALSDDADIYREAVESALQLWREGKIADISALELRALFDGEFWVLSSRTRNSGAGFVLKRTLANARRELEAAGAKQ